MVTRTLAARLPSPLPKLAATALICWALGANTYFDNVSTVRSAEDAYETAVPAAYPEADIPAMHILSAKDASRYLGIFAAQANGDWKNADKIIHRLTDRQLMGHILADRYSRRPASAQELQVWLEKYADLPEAEDIYKRALKTSGKDAGLTPPEAAHPWIGGDSYGASVVAFRMGSLEVHAPAARHFAAKFNSELHHGNPSAAEALLGTEEHRHTLSLAEASKAQGLVAAGYFYNGETSHAHRVAEAGAKQQDILALWIGGLSAWKLNDMHAAGDDFALLAAQTKLSPSDRAAAQFWAWRTLKRTGETKNAKFWLEQAAAHPHSFYGRMAAGVMGDEHGWSWELPVLGETQVAVLKQQKAGERALALLQIGKQDLAESELHNLNPQGHHDLQEAMLALATAEHMPSLALQLGGVATKPNGDTYDAALYPLPPWQPTQGFTVDRALVYALMRHESQFDPQAVSDRGACGLMQLLPGTAKLMADSVAAADCSGKLLDPSFNMMVGQKYMLHLAGQPMIGDNLLLILAAYNSGPTNLSHWMDDDRAAARKNKHAAAVVRHFDYEKEDPLFFLESLPFRQTHDYVEQVMIHYWGYRARLDENEASLTDLANGKWPKMAPPENHVATKPVKDAALPAAKPARAVKMASSQK